MWVGIARNTPFEYAFDNEWISFLRPFRTAQFQSPDIQNDI